MKNFGKFRKISGRYPTDTEQKKIEEKVEPKSNGASKRNAYLIILAKHNREIRKLTDESDKR